VPTTEHPPTPEGPDPQPVPSADAHPITGQAAAAPDKPVATSRRSAGPTLELNAELWGDGAPLLLLHGFTGSAATWAPFRARLGAARRLIAVDLLGHGASPSPADPAAYALEREVERLVGRLDRLGIGRADVLGYSMGGRVALLLALAHPERVGRLVLESASPGLGDPLERAARVRSDAVLADLLEREGIAPFVDRWERAPLFASQARLPAERRAALRSDRLRRDPLGLANSLRGAGQGTAPPVLDRLGEVSAPTLLIVGALDERYVAFGRLMAERIPDAGLVVVPEAGHAVHLERPAAFERAVADFLDGSHDDVRRPAGTPAGGARPGAGRDCSEGAAGTSAVRPSRGYGAGPRDATVSTVQGEALAEE